MLCEPTCLAKTFLILTDFFFFNCSIEIRPGQQSDYVEKGAVFILEGKKNPLFKET